MEFSLRWMGRIHRTGTNRFRAYLRRGYKGDYSLRFLRFGLSDNCDFAGGIQTLRRGLALPWVVSRETQRGAADIQGL